jgi:hypothetical protein
MSPEPPRRIQIVAFDLVRVIQFLNSVAYAQAALNHTRLQWRPDQDFAKSRVFRSVYSALGYTPPGTVEIAQDVGRIDSDRAQLLAQHWHATLNKIVCGPVPLLAYLRSMEDVKDYASKATREVFRDAGQINSEIAGATHEAIERLARIRLASTLFILPTAVGAGIGAAAVGAAGLALDLGVVSASYQVIGSFARSVQEAHSAKAIAIQTGKPAAEYAVDKGYEVVEDKVKKAAEKRLEKAEPLIKQGERDIAKLAQQLKQKTSTKKIAKLGRQLERKTDALSGPLQQSKNATRAIRVAETAGVVLQLAFLAYDLYEAVEEFKQDTRAGE